MSVSIDFIPITDKEVARIKSAAWRDKPENKAKRKAYHAAWYAKNKAMKEMANESERSMTEPKVEFVERWEC